MSKGKNKKTVPFMRKDQLAKAVAKNAAAPEKELGDITFNCTETGQKIVMKVKGKGPSIVTDMEFMPPLTDKKDVPMTPVLQIFSMLTQQLRGMG